MVTILMEFGEHIASGMYGEIVVHATNENMPKNSIWYSVNFIILVDSGLFKGTSGKIGSFSLDKFIAIRPT